MPTKKTPETTPSNAPAGNADYQWATEELCAVAAECCAGRLVSTLEGGYDLAALASSTATHVRALMAA